MHHDLSGSSDKDRHGEDLSMGVRIWKKVKGRKGRRKEQSTIHGVKKKTSEAEKKNIIYFISPHKRLAPSEYILAFAQWNRTSVDGIPDDNSSKPL